MLCPLTLLYPSISYSAVSMPEVISVVCTMLTDKKYNLYTLTFSKLMQKHGLSCGSFVTLVKTFISISLQWFCC